MLPIYPLSLLPVRVGGVLLSLACLFTLGYVAYRRGAKPLALALFICAPQVQFMAINGDYIDVLSALGFVLPPQIGLFFVLAKPQSGAAVALFWAVEAWRKGKAREVARVFAPVTLAYALQLVCYSPNMLDALLTRAPHMVGMGAYHDANIWPYGVILGIFLLAYAIRKGDIGPAILSSACFTPYLGFYSWPVALLGLLSCHPEFILATLFLWIPAWLYHHS
ncbi:MAG: hypothetical protein GYA17_03150 [Chloroflexi bacterium]|nr:hypothetical protein [Chloroflexota bacterium]